ncbi:MAG: alpha/beta fold hydrolase [Fibrobacteria bacterium]|nr:alpha/beta fold hydrolase [Fibrobacteria bacterium]
MPTFSSSDGIRLAYSLEGEGEPLLLLNGLFGDREFWDPVSSLLAPRRRCILLDHRGIGGSDRPAGPYSFSLWARDAVELLDHLGISSAPVLGLCHGGMVGAVIALEHPSRIRGLVCHGTRLLESAKLRVFDNLRRNLLALGGLELLMSAQMGLIFGERSLSEIEPYLGKMSAGAHRRTTPEAAEGMLEALVEFALAESQLAGLDLPALFLAGEEDLYVAPWMCRRTAQAWPRAEFDILPEVGHIVPREAPSELARRTLDFLDRKGI